MHMEAHLLDSVGDVWLGEDEVLQCPGKTLVTGGISHPGAVGGGSLALSVHQSRAWLTVSHDSALENVDGVLALVEKQTLGSMLHSDPQVVVSSPRSFVVNSC